TRPRQGRTAPAVRVCRAVRGAPRRHPASSDGRSGAAYDPERPVAFARADIFAQSTERFAALVAVRIRRPDPWRRHALVSLGARVRHLLWRDPDHRVAVALGPPRGARAQT